MKENKHTCFPQKQYKWAGIRHVGIKSCWVGRCWCGQILKYTNDGIFSGWFTTDDSILTRFVESKEEDIH